MAERYWLIGPLYRELRNCQNATVRDTNQEEEQRILKVPDPWGECNLRCFLIQAELGGQYYQSDANTRRRFLAVAAL